MRKGKKSKFKAKEFIICKIKLNYIFCIFMLYVSFCFKGYKHSLEKKEL